MLAKLKSVLKGSMNQVRGYSLSCVTYHLEKACDDPLCKTCKIASLVRGFGKLVERNDYVDGYRRKFIFSNQVSPKLAKYFTISVFIGCYVRANIRNFCRSDVIF